MEQLDIENMPYAEFEKLISVEDNVDLDGFVFKANEEFGIREFLTDTVYTDSMLNHIIGPAAIYAVHGEDVDIIRFNEMFYRAVNVPDFNEKLLGIQKVMPEHEVPELFRTLRKFGHLRGAFSPVHCLFFAVIIHIDLSVLFNKVHMYLS